jgi:DNA-binding transcriptional ArsR family regulator
MSNPQAGPPIPFATIPLADILGAIGNPARWNLLRELAGGDQLMVTELAERIGQSFDATSKHMAVLRTAGIAIQARNRLYSVAPQFIANKTERVLDFGYCLLRMNVGSEQQ